MFKINPKQRAKLHLIMDGVMIFCFVMHATVVVCCFMAENLSALSALGSTLSVLGFVGMGVCLFKLYKAKQANPKVVPVGLFYPNVASAAVSMCGVIMFFSAKVWETNLDGAMAAAAGRMNSLAWLATMGVACLLYWYAHPENLSAVLNDKHENLREIAEDFAAFHRSIADSMGHGDKETGELFLAIQKSMADTLQKRRLVVQMARDMGCSEEEIAKLEQELGVAHIPPTSDVREVLMDVIKDASNRTS